MTSGQTEKLGTIVTGILVAGAIAADVVIPGPFSLVVLPALLGKKKVKKRRVPKPHAVSERLSVQVNEALRRSPIPKSLHPSGAVVIARGTDPRKGWRGPKPGTLIWEKTLVSVRSTLALNGLHLGRPIGRGSWGIVYANREDPEALVKVTSDYTEAAAVSRLLEALQAKETSWRNLPSLAQFHCVYAVLDDRDQDTGLFAIVVEKMNTAVPRNIGKYIEDMGGHFITAVRDDRYAEEAVETAKERGLDPVEARRFTKTIVELHRIGIPWHDLHDGNVMLDAEGHWKIIDLGYIKQGRTADAEVPALAGEPLDSTTAGNDTSVVEKLGVAEMLLIAGDMALPDPVPGTPGPITFGILAREGYINTDGPPPRDYAWLPLGEIEPAVPVMRQRHVSGVAHRGFLTAYRHVGGDAGYVDSDWARRRYNFIHRHLAQAHAHRERLWDGDGDPTPRALALVSWAYHPEHAKWRAWLRRNGADV